MIEGRLNSVLKMLPAPEGARSHTCEKALRESATGLGDPAKNRKSSPGKLPLFFCPLIALQAVAQLGVTTMQMLFRWVTPNLCLGLSFFIQAQLGVQSVAMCPFGEPAPGPAGLRAEYYWSVLALSKSALAFALGWTSMPKLSQKLLYTLSLRLCKARCLRLFF